MRTALLVQFALLGLICLLMTGFSFGDLTPERIESITSAVKSIGKAARPLAEDEEYYVGRAVAAVAVARDVVVEHRLVVDVADQLIEPHPTVIVVVVEVEIHLNADPAADAKFVKAITENPALRLPDLKLPHRLRNACAMLYFSIFLLPVMMK